jgi:TRAP-type C4-dicarboxylate transport system substrate-binding protein
VTITITAGGYQPPASIHNVAARRFGERLTQRLGDRVAFELIPSVLDLGRPSAELPVMVESGELSLCYMSTVRFSADVPELQLLELPFLVRDRATIWRALDGELGALFTERMHATTPFRVLGLWDNGFRHLTNKIRPIRRPEDCRGLRIRTQGSALHGEVFKALGFEPMAIDIKRFVQEVAGDTIDAHDNPLTSIYVFGVHRHHRHVTLTGHFFGASFLLCNASHYRGWPADVRAAVDEAAREATALQRRLAATEDADVLAKLDPRENDVVQLTPAEHAAFVDAVRPVRARLERSIDPAFLRRALRLILGEDRGVGEPPAKQVSQDRA